MVVPLALIRTGGPLLAPFRPGKDRLMCSESLFHCWRLHSYLKRRQWRLSFVPAHFHLALRDEMSQNRKGAGCQAQAERNDSHLATPFLDWYKRYIKRLVFHHYVAPTYSPRRRCFRGKALLTKLGEFWICEFQFQKYDTEPMLVHILWVICSN